MKELIFLAFLALLLRSSHAGLFSSCQVEGVLGEWMLGYTVLKGTINDTHRGVVATLKTEEILEMEVESGKYLTATFENKIITLYTTEEFKNFKNDIDETDTDKIAIKLNFKCSYSTDWLTIYQRVVHTKDHDLILNRQVYEYSIGMTIPENFDLTTLLPINAYSPDLKNYVYFQMDFNEDLTLRHTTYVDRDSKIASTTLKALKELKAPFRQEFSIVATDDKDPPRSTPPSKLIVTVYSNPNDNENAIHPPVFSKHLYFADYTTKQGLMFYDMITISYGGQNDTKIQQSDYTEYFTVQLKDSNTKEVEVIQKQKLPDEIIKENDLLVVEIEGENPGLTIKGRTALVIRVHDEIAMIHPPVFEKHLYFADYSTDKGLIPEESIKIKYGIQSNTKVQLADYTNYLRVHLKDTATGEIEITVEQKLPQSIFEGQDFLIVDIEAVNPGLTIKGRTALIIRNTDGNNGGEGNLVHPPVFEKHVYFADYSPEQGLRMNEVIAIKFGYQKDTTIEQSDHKEYFKIFPEVSGNGVVKVETTGKVLPEEVVERNDMLVIEIKAFNPGLEIPGRATLIIRLNNESVCHVTNVWTSPFGDSIVPLILGFTSILIIIFLNITVLGLYVWKRRYPKFNDTVA